MSISAGTRLASYELLAQIQARGKIAAFE